MFVWSGETLWQWHHMLSMFHAQRVFDLPWFRARSVSHTHHSEQGRSASFEQLLGSSHRRPLNKYGNIKTAQVRSDPKTLIDEWSSSSQVANFLAFMGIWQFHHTLLSKNHRHPWHSCRDPEWSLPPWAENIGGDDDINHLCHGKRVTQERTTGWTCPFLCQSRAFHDTIPQYHRVWKTYYVKHVNKINIIIDHDMNNIYAKVQLPWTNF